MDESRYEKWLKFDQCEKYKDCNDCKFNDVCCDFGVTKRARAIQIKLKEE